MEATLERYNSPNNYHFIQAYQYKDYQGNKYAGATQIPNSVKNVKPS
jgi:hypothetical protein